MWHYATLYQYYDNTVPILWHYDDQLKINSILLTLESRIAPRSQSAADEISKLTTGLIPLSSCKNTWTRGWVRYPQRRIKYHCTVCRRFDGQRDEDQGKQVAKDGEKRWCMAQQNKTKQTINQNQSTSNLSNNSLWTKKKANYQNSKLSDLRTDCMLVMSRWSPGHELR